MNVRQSSGHAQNANSPTRRRYCLCVPVLCAFVLNAWPVVELLGSRCLGADLVAPFSSQTAKQAQNDWAAQSNTRVCLTNVLGMSMMFIPPGEFMMGSPDDEVSLWDRHQPDELLHCVRLTRPFRMAAHEVRVRDFRAFVSATNFQTDVEKDPKGGWALVNGVFKQDPQFNWRNPGFAQQDDFPVVFVSWNDATAFCKWLSSKEKTQYRLPTEAEWEYACRAGTTSPYYFGSSCNGTQANCDGKHLYGTKEQGPFLRRTCSAVTYTANAFGLFDMSGNAYEWCSDWYLIDYFENSPTVDPRGPEIGTTRTVRGGGWATWAQTCRSANRGGAAPNDGNIDCGFRIVADVAVGEIVPKAQSAH